jgi:hypothetical protein
VKKEISLRQTNLLVWWVLWGSLLLGVFQAYYFIAYPKTPPPPQNSDNFLGLFPLATILASCAIRWLWLPRIAHPSRALPIYILGLALAEACVFLGIFVVPAYQQEFFFLGILGLAQFVPIFAGRYFPSTEATR